ncbi:hypothetical protein AB6C88_19930 [Vibrio splendidus]
MKNLKTWDELVNKHVTEKEVKNIVKADNAYTKKADEIVKECANNQAVLYVANAGDGKSRVAGEIPNIVNSLPLMPHNKRCVFCTNTRYNRDEFVKNNPIFKAVKGVSEIIGEVAGKSLEHAYSEEFKHRLEKYEEEKKDEYKKPMYPSSKDILKHLLDIGYLTGTQLMQIKSKLAINTDIANCDYIAMTVAKIQVGEMVKRYSGRYIMLDEMTVKNTLSVSGTVKAYSKDDFEVLINENIERFINNLHEMTKNDVLTNFVLFSAEKSLKQAFESKNMPVVDSVDVGEPITVIDKSLTVIIVKHTTEEFTNNIIEYGKKHGYQSIADGEAVNSDYSFEAAKGRNDLKQADLITILRHPHPFAFTPYMTALGIDEEEAIKVYSSDSANQAIGRNTGYRSEGGKHVLVINKDMYDKGLIELDTVGDVHICTKREQVNDLPDGFIKDLCGELYKAKDNTVSKAALGVISDLLDIGYDKEVKGTDYRALITAHLLENGCTENRIRKEGLVKAVSIKAQSLGVREVIKKKVKYYLMPSS